MNFHYKMRLVPQKWNFKIFLSKYPLTNAIYFSKVLKLDPEADLC